MEAAQGVKVQYDVITKRVDVSYGDRRVTLSGQYKTIEAAKQAAERYAKKYMIKK